MALGQVELLTLAEQKSATIFSALGLGDLSGDMHVRNLSGGQKTRLALAGLLLSIPPHTPSLLLLDEPTNHLDLEMLEWLEDWLLSPSLSKYNGILLVSHDRAFLDNVTTGILELDLQTHKPACLSRQLYPVPGSKAGRNGATPPGVHRPAGRDRPSTGSNHPRTQRGALQAGW